MAAPENDPAGGHPPADGAAATSPATPKRPLKIPRVSPATIAQRREEGTGGSGSKVNLEDLITWLREGTKPGQTESQQSTLSKDKRKFRRYDPPPPQAAEAVVGSTTKSVPTDAAVESAPAPPAVEAASTPGTPRAGETAVLADFVPRGSRRAPAATRSRFSSLGVQAGALALLAACFYLGRWTVRVNQTAPDKPPTALAPRADQTAGNISDAALAVIDQAIAAENAGDLKTAGSLYDQLRNGPEHINGLDFQIGWLDYRAGHSAAAAVATDRSIAEGEAVSECYGLRGLMLISHAKPFKSLRDFELAARTSPFDAAGFFHWGDALRRTGKPQAALVHLREALARTSAPEAAAEYQFKVRLTQIELGQEKDFAKELAAQLASPKPEMEWELTAAAVDMHNDNYPAAAADLDRARQFSDPAKLASALGDYFFAGYAEKEPIRPIYAEICRSPHSTPPPTVAPVEAAAPADSLPVTSTSLAVPDRASSPPAATP